MNRDLARIGLRGVWRNPRRAIVTGGMIALGVAAIVFFRGYVLGLNDLMLGMVIDQAEGAMQVERAGYSDARDIAPLDLDVPLDGGLVERVAAAPGVRAVTPRLRFSALLLRDEDEPVIVMGLGVDPSGERRVCPKGPQAGHGWVDDAGGKYGLDGPGLTDHDDAGIIVGSEIARGLKVKVGDTVTLLAQTQRGGMDAVDVVVRGTLRVGDVEINKRLVVVPLALAQRLVHMPNRATGLVVATARDEIATTAAALRRELASVAPALAVRTWDEIAPYYRDVARLQGDLMRLVMGLLFILLLAGIVNTTSMAVFERQREIGTLMALGLRRRAILALFLIEAAVLGLLSSAIGAGLGAIAIALSRLKGFAFRVPGVGVLTNLPRIDVGYMVVAVLVAVAAALLAGLIPAWRAARLQPVEALRAT